MVTRALALFVVSLTAATGCAPPPAVAPVTFAFHPAPGRGGLPLSTPSAVELESERAARAVEATDGDFVGELSVRGARVRHGDVALLAAKYGATHFRVMTAGDEPRLDVVLYRVDEERWPSLPDELRPTRAAGRVVGEEGASRAL